MKRALGLLGYFKELVHYQLGGKAIGIQRHHGQPSSRIGKVYADIYQPLGRAAFEHLGKPMVVIPKYLNTLRNAIHPVREHASSIHLVDVGSHQSTTFRYKANAITIR